MVKGFVQGVAWQAGRAMMCKADGTGLPKKPGGAFYALVALAMVTTVLRHGVMGTIHPVAAGLAFLVSIVALALAFGEKRFPCVGIYLCLILGINVVAVGVALAGIAFDGLALVLMAWEAAGFVAGCRLYVRRVRGAAAKTE